MVKVPLLYTPDTPFGKLPEVNAAPVAFAIVKVMAVIGVFTHLVWVLVPVPEDKVMEGGGLIVRVPVACGAEVQGAVAPATVTVKLKVPDCIGVPDIV